MVSPCLIGPAPLPSTEISNTPRLSSMPEVSRDTRSVADTVPLPSGRVSHVPGLDTSTGRGRTPRRPTGLRACRTARPGARRSSRGRMEAPRSGRRSPPSLSTPAYTHWPRARPAPEFNAAADRACLATLDVAEGHQTQTAHAAMPDCHNGGAYVTDVAGCATPHAQDPPYLHPSRPDRPVVGAGCPGGHLGGEQPARLRGGGQRLR